jgi:DNA-binding IclR family transcriptional regulator
VNERKAGKTPGGTRVQVVERAIDILDVLGRGHATLSEVTKDVGLPKGTTYRILSSLQYRGLVVKDPVDNSWLLGPGFLRMSQAQTPWFGALAFLAEPAMKRVLEQSRETVALHVRVGTERICVAELPSPEPIRYSAKVGEPLPLYVGATGKILLAQIDPPALERMVGILDLQPMTEKTILDPDVLLASVIKARDDGYAMSEGERVDSSAGISVPIRPRPTFDASLSLLGPADRFTKQRRLDLLDDLLAAAKEIGETAAL